MVTWSPALFSALTMDCAANRLEPSTSASVGVWPVTKATSTLLSWSSCSASAWSSPGSTTVTSKNADWLVSRAATCVACGPTTAAFTLRDVEVGGVPEDHEQQQRHHDQHREGAAVAAQLAELLDDHRPHGGDAMPAPLRDVNA